MVTALIVILLGFVGIMLRLQLGTRIFSVLVRWNFFHQSHDHGVYSQNYLSQFCSFDLWHGFVTESVITFSIYLMLIEFIRQTINSKYQMERMYPKEDREASLPPNGIGTSVMQH